MDFSIDKDSNLRGQFPILGKKIDGKRLVYLDNAATTQKPASVINAINYYYTHTNANVHRGSYNLANHATQAIENVRSKVQNFIHAKSNKEIIFTSGTTSAMNLIASTYGRVHVQQGDEILISRLSHHSSFLPWQRICQEKGALIKEIPITQNGCIDVHAFSRLLSKRTKVVAVNYVSNVLGTINPLQSIVNLSHQHQAIVVVDAAQAVPHFQVDVQALHCDFLAFSSHKMYGPTGLGILYAEAELLEKLPPYQLGGGMVRTAALDKALYENIPYRFEAGTPHIAGIVGLGAAIDFLVELSYDQLEKHEKDLLCYAQNQLADLPHIRLLSTEGAKIGIISFVVNNMHALDVGMRLDAAGVAVRTGHHCAAPLMQYLSLEDGGTVRISLAIYNDRSDINTLIKTLDDLRK